MRRPLLIGAAVALAAAALVGCDDRKCLEAHTTLMTTVVAGPKGQTHVQLVPVTTCDRYEEAP
ncbi:hypothetical protein [Kitasatospora purpeofusca]|uniref:hypothetical protein n=1 Tax=Kitasatospora purpeofusca TaxID=67352 RepID=UPI0035DE6AC0